MVASKRDLRPMIPAGSAAAIAAIVLAVTGWVAAGWLDQRERAFQRARNDLAAAASQYRNASDDQAVYEQYAARFRDMSSRGWIGTEQRLSWIEALQQINRDLELPTLRYEIAQRHEVPLAAARFDVSRLKLYRTTMQLTLGALHEGDLLALLGPLGERGRGLAALERCDLRRAQPAGEIRLDPGATNLDIACTLHWYSLDIRSERDA